MKTNELKTKEIAELESELLSLRREQFNLRIQRGLGQTPKPHQFSKVKKNIARIKTFINQKKRNVSTVGDAQ